VMAARSTGFGLMASGSIQEVMDLALIATASALKSRVPFVHFFDGFRSSHEIQKIKSLADDDIRAMIDEEDVLALRARAMTPDRPVLRGTAQNPDVFFQGRETVNPYYDACPGIVQQMMDRFGKITGRPYKLFDYVGAPDAERVVVLMSSGVEAAHEAVEYLVGKGEKVGVIKVRLYRPFSGKDFVAALPKTVKAIAVLDRTKEPGATGEPLYQDVVTALSEAIAGGTAPFPKIPCIVGGRYGLSSKEFTPAMVKAVLDNLAAKQPKNHFTVGITDDVTHTSLDYDAAFVTEGDDVVRAMFYGLGSDGTVGANKNSIKIIGEGTDNYAQGYFVYDSKKAGAITVSHLRFGPRPIRSTYLVNAANFVACHQWFFLEKYDMLKSAVPGATFLLNSIYGPDEVWDHLPRQVQQQIIDKKLKFYVIDAYKVADETGMGVRINTIMQTCFFAISGVLPRDEAIAKIKDAIKKTYGKKGDEVVQMNFNAVDASIANLHEVNVPAEATSTIEMPPPVAPEAPEFVQEVTGEIMAGRGDDVPVSKMPVDGSFPLGTTQWEKRNIALEIPVWDPEVCIQCLKCTLACPHSVIRGAIYDASCLEGAPPTFKSCDARGKEFAGKKFTLQVAPEDCTSCGVCVFICPAKNKKVEGRKAINMEPQPPLREQERDNWRFFLTLPEIERSQLKVHTVKGAALLHPLFEFSGACAGCGETPYVSLLSRLFGDRAVIANATGCSSIYGGNLPTTPWTSNKDGRGPTWSNSLFEDCAEFGFGFRLTIDKLMEFAEELVEKLSGEIGEALAKGLLEADQSTEQGIQEQRERVAKLRTKLDAIGGDEARQLESLADYLVKKSVWSLGGDGWAYDIGYGGLDHVLASGRNINLLVLDSEVYSNTGGQASKATPRGAVAKFAAAGRPSAKKDLGLMAMTYGNVYVASVALGANDAQCVKAFLEAESYDGPSIIIAYSHCIAHGISNMGEANDIQKRAVASGHWILYRYDPRRSFAGGKPLQLDSKPPSIEYKQYAYTQNRFRMLTKSKPKLAEELLELAQYDANRRWQLYQQMAEMQFEPLPGVEQAKPEAVEVASEAEES